MEEEAGVARLEEVGRYDVVLSSVVQHHVVPEPKIGIDAKATGHHRIQGQVLLAGALLPEPFDVVLVEKPLLVLDGHVIDKSPPAANMAAAAGKCATQSVRPA